MKHVMPFALGILATFITVDICSCQLVLSNADASLYTGMEIVTEIELLSTWFGLSRIPDYLNTSNVSVGYLSSTAMDDWCVTGKETLFHGTVDVVVTYTQPRFRCDLVNMCDLSPVWLELTSDLSPRKMHGIMHSSGYAPENDVPCTYLVGLASDTAINASFFDDGVLQYGSIMLQKSKFTAFKETPGLIIYSRLLLPLCCLFISVCSVLILWKRYILRKLNRTHTLLLCLNMVQAFFLMIMHVLGCLHYLDDTCSLLVQNLLWTELSGVSVSTDLLFLALLQGVIFDMSKHGLTPPSTVRIRVCAMAILVLEVSVVFVYGLLPPNSTGYMALVGIIYFFVTVIVIVYMLYTMRKLIVILKNYQDVDTESSLSASLQQLGLRFNYYSRFAIISGCLLLSTIVLYGTELFQKDLGWYMLHIVLIDVSKILNMYSQTMVLWPIIAKTNPNRRKVGTSNESGSQASKMVDTHCSR